MSTRQYIGARYIPLYIGIWDNTITYEPLSIVSYNNNSYTSKKFVPAGVEITNTEYWFMSGNFNAQIAGLEGRVQNVENSVSTAEGDISTLQTGLQTAEGNISTLQTGLQTAEGNISTLQTGLQTANGDISTLQTGLQTAEGNISTLDQRVDALENAPAARGGLLLVCDSYGNITDSSGKNFAQNLIDETGKTDIYQVAAGGAAFATSMPVSFLSVVQSFAGDKSKITDIIIIGGANDQNKAESEIAAGMTAFNTWVKNNFANIERINLFGCGLTFNYTLGGSTGRYNLASYYRRNANSLGWIYTVNSEFLLRNTKLLQSDKCHPSTDGITEISRQLVNAYNSGAIHVEYSYDSAFTTATGFNVTSVFNMKRTNGVVTLTPTGGAGLTIRGSFVADGNKKTFGTFENTLMDQTDNQARDYFQSGALFINGSAISGHGTCACAIENNNLTGYPLDYPSATAQATQVKITDLFVAIN